VPGERGVEERMNNTYEDMIKSFKGKEITIALTSTANGDEHYYKGKLLDVTEETIKMLVRLKGRIRRRHDIVFLNRKAFVILYVAVKVVK